MDPGCPWNLGTVRPAGLEAKPLGRWKPRGTEIQIQVFAKYYGSWKPVHVILGHFGTFTSSELVLSRGDLVRIASVATFRIEFQQEFGAQILKPVQPVKGKLTGGTHKNIAKQTRVKLSRERLTLQCYRNSCGVYGHHFTP